MLTLTKIHILLSYNHSIVNRIFYKMPNYQDLGIIFDSVSFGWNLLDPGMVTLCYCNHLLKCMLRFLDHLFLDFNSVLHLLQAAVDIDELCLFHV